MGPIESLQEALCRGPLSLELRRDTAWRFEILPIPAAVPTSNGLPCLYLFQARHRLLARTKGLMWKGRLIQVWHRDPSSGAPNIADKDWMRTMTEEATAYAHKNSALELPIWPVVQRLTKMRHTRAYCSVDLPAPDVCRVPVFEADISTWARAQSPAVQSVREALAADAVRALGLVNRQTRDTLLTMAGLPQEDPK